MNVWRNQQSGMGFVAAAVGGGVATGTLAGAGWAAIAVPIIGPALAAVTLGVMALMKKHAQQKVAATQVVDSIEPFMAENRDAYLAVRNRGAQEQALINFDAMWADVVRACSDPQLGSAGQRCINERQRGGRWDWFAYYRDPIANDTAAADPVVTTGTVGAVIAPVTDALANSPYRQFLPLLAGLLIVAGIAGARR